MVLEEPKDLVQDGTTINSGATTEAIRLSEVLRILVGVNVFYSAWVDGVNLRYCL